MTLYWVFSNNVSNAELRVQCEHEDGSGDYLLCLTFCIKMNNPSGVPPKKDLFDEQIESIGSTFDDT